MFIDDYKNGTSGEDGPMTRDEMIEAEQFGGDIDEEEAVQMATNALISTVRDYVAPHAGGVVVGVIIGIAVAASFLFDNSDLLWRAN